MTTTLKELKTKIKNKVMKNLTVNMNLNNTMTTVVNITLCNIRPNSGLIPICLKDKDIMR